jgi:glyoxylase-like metal-dependent hydrolase (beta-lactamase superfamily II)
VIQTLFKSKANPFAPRQYGELQKVSDQVYIFRNITNSSFVVGDRSVAVIDTQVNESGAKLLLSFIRSVTDKPIEFVINTHYHWDHTNGNQIFKNEGAMLISSKLTKEFMQVRAPRQKEFLSGRGFELGNDPLLPEIVFEGEYRIDLGNSPLRIFFAGCAESDDASAVHAQKDNVLMSGDTIMTGSFPIFGQPVWDEGLQGDGRWQETIRQLMSLKPKHIVPGHGPLAHEKDVELLLKIENYFIEEVGALVKKNYSVTQVLRDLEKRLPSWITKIPLVWGTPRYAILRVYRGLTKKPGDQNLGWQSYKPSVIPSVDSHALEIRVAGKSGFADLLRMASEAKEGGDIALQISILKKASQEFPERCFPCMRRR